MQLLRAGAGLKASKLVRLVCTVLGQGRPVTVVLVCCAELAPYINKVARGK